MALWQRNNGNTVVSRSRNSGSVGNGNSNSISNTSKGNNAVSGGGSSSSSSKRKDNHNYSSNNNNGIMNMILDFIIQWKSYYCTYLLCITILFAIIQMIQDHSISSTMHTTKTTTTTTTTDTTSSSRQVQQQQQLQKQQQQARTIQDNSNTIAYVVTITSCNGHEKDKTFQIVEGAAVLQYSIHRNSIRQKTQSQSQQKDHDNSNSNGGSFDYHMYAIYHPEAKLCAEALIDIGYTIVERPTPVAVSDIQNAELRERIVHNGCCGEKELIKLEALTFIQYPLVVLLDIDILVLQPLDRLFHFMLDPIHVPPNDDDLLYYNRPAISGPNSINITIPQHIDLLYTTDYAMVHAERKIKPTQGGFVILRPNMTIYQDFITILQEGDFQFEGRTDLGWGGRTGRFWGAMTFQGLMPYYYQILHPGRALELNWCRWNNMYSPSYDEGNKKQYTEIKKCYTLQPNCENCRLRNIEDISLIHYTVCQKPWLCQFHTADKQEGSNLCAQFHQEWFKVRSKMEISWGRTGNGTSTWQYNTFLGYCKSYGHHGYIPIEKPYGQPLVVSDASSSLWK